MAEPVTRGNSVWGWPGNRQYYGVCQYPGRCYHSEACMAGVGNDVTHLGTAPLEIRPYWPFIRSNVHRESFLYADPSFAVRLPGGTRIALFFALKIKQK